MVLNQLLIFASVILVLPPHMTLVVSISLVGLTLSLVFLSIIIYTWCGSPNIFLCIPICVNGIHISVPNLLKLPFKHVLKTVQTRLIAYLFLKYRSKTRLMASLFFGNFYEHVCSYSLLPQWLRLHISIRLKYCLSLASSMNTFFHRT